MTSVDWEDGGITIGNGSDFIWVAPSDAEELIDRMRQVLDEHPEE